MKVKKPLPVKYKETEKKVFELVSKTGFSQAKVLQRLKLPHNYFNAYLGTKEAYNHALSVFSEKLMGVVVEQMPYSASDRKYIMEKLRLLETPFEITKPKDAISASKTLADALILFSKNEISTEQLQQVRSSCQVFSELHVNVVMQEDIKRLYALVEERFKDEEA